MEKGKKNVDPVARKLRPASLSAINHRLEVANEKGLKKEKMVERRKAETLAAKRYKAKGKISLSVEEEDENNTKDDMDLDQADDKYPLSLQY